jgi:hypothetical protein
MSLKHGAGEECEKIKWTDRITNGKVFRRTKEERSLLEI